MPDYLSAASAAAFALIHLFIGRIHFLDVVPRSRWLSFAGGVAVAYVFLHVLPELSAHQETFSEGLGLAPASAETWVYAISLAGLAIFYGLERAAKGSRQRSRQSGGGDRVETRIFWIHIGSFAIYNLLVGYLLLHREQTGLGSLLLYSVAMALHFVTNDFGLRQDHKERYDHAARWLLAAAALLGWGLGLVTTVPEVVVGFLFAFLAGAVVLNVLKEELPEERQSRLIPFLLGLACLAGLLMLA